MTKYFRLLVLAILAIGWGSSYASAQTTSASPYCQPYSYAYCAGYDYAGIIHKVSVGSFTNNSECTEYPQYIYYNNLQPIQLLAGMPTLFKVDAIHEDGTDEWLGSYRGAITIWVDFNGNNYFDGNEMIMTDMPFADARSTGVTFTIPTTATTGTWRMRVRSSIGTDINNNGYPSSYYPCDYGTYGEIEDYNVTILPPLADPSPTAIALTMPGSSSGVPLPAAAGTYDIGFTLSNTGVVSLISVDYDFTVTNVATNTVIASGSNVTWAGDLTGGSTTIVKLLTNAAINNPLTPYRVQVTLKNAKSPFADGDNNPNNNVLDGFIGPALNGGDYYVG
ncbi:MAG: hypothetical protein IT283_03225, partial [Bacteroidetes bacterium]|nr:hypothetical protein [Bacteroidota bacterium]